MHIYEFNSYRSYLKAELAHKTARNPKYSLRALAKQLNVASSTLSDILKGRLDLSVTRAHKIALALRLKNEELNYFCDLVRIEGEKDLEVRSQQMERMVTLYPRARRSTDLSIEQFRQISEWYHHALIEMPLLKGFSVDPQSVSKSLDIPKPLAELAIDRLIELGFFERTAEGKIARQYPELRMRSELKNSAMKKYYRDMLEKISTSLEEQSPQERLSGYLNLPINKKALPEIDSAIDRFFAEIKTIADKYKDKKEIYHLSLHFINQMKREKANE
jgi:uncharacterized protein (TIGR02147 family)